MDQQNFEESSHKPQRVTTYVKLPHFIDQIYEFNQKAGLLDKPYDDFLESSFQIEEALEGFPNLASAWIRLSVPNASKDSLLVADTSLEVKNNVTAKHLSRILVDTVMDGSTALSDVDRLDKACDAIVFAVGSIAKLKLTPAQLSEAMLIVMNANLAKLGMPKDEHGKLMKPEGFVGPEVELQALLDRRTLW